MFRLDPLEFLINIVVFLVVLSVLVLVHEFGHFFAARLSGISAVEFALGLPFTKSIWSKKLKGGLKLSLYPILFGGFVRLLGEEGEASLKEKQIATKGIDFSKASIWSRIFVVISGVVMNFFLAVVLLYIFLAITNFKVLLPKYVNYSFLSPNETRVVIAEVLENSPASQAKIKNGELVISVDGVAINSGATFKKYVREKAGVPLEFLLESSDFSQTRKVVATPRVNPSDKQGALGVRIDDVYFLSFHSITQKLTSGVTFSIDMLSYQLRVIGTLFSTAAKTGSTAPVTDNVSGPIYIFKIIGDILSLGGMESIKALLNFVAILSLSLAFMNVLPIPAFDGGKLFFLLVELVTRKKVPSRIENFVNQTGMVFIILLIVAISLSDVLKIVHK